MWSVPLNGEEKNDSPPCLQWRLRDRGWWMTRGEGKHGWIYRLMHFEKLIGMEWERRYKAGEHVFGLLFNKHNGKTLNYSLTGQLFVTNYLAKLITENYSYIFFFFLIWLSFLSVKPPSLSSPHSRDTEFAFNEYILLIAVLLYLAILTCWGKKKSSGCFVLSMFE